MKEKTEMYTKARQTDIKAIGPTVMLYFGGLNLANLPSGNLASFEFGDFLVLGKLKAYQVYFREF